MSLRTWWIGVQLGRIESKLKQTRSRQKRNRTQLDELAHTKGLTPLEMESRRGRLEAERERLTRDVNRLHGQEARLRQELKAAQKDAGDRATA